MSTKTYATNPTANLFELLQVDSDLPEKRTSNKSGGQAKKPVDAPTFETPAEKGQRRKAAEAQKAAAAAAEKQRKDAEEAMAALIPQEGFQVQKGSATKKPAEAKPKAMKREDFETQEKPKDNQKQFRGPGNPKKFDGTGKPDGQKNFTDKRQNTQPSNRPPRHEGFDKHSGGKTTNKPPAKRKGDGTGNWGNDTSPQTGGWPEDVVTTPSTTDGAGWGDEGDKKAEKSANTTQGWGDEGDKKPEKDTKEDGEPKEEKDKKPAWDDEGFGKMTLEEFQKTVAAEREQKLAALKVGPKAPGRQIETTIDLSKCSYRNTTDEKERKLAEERKKELAEERKKKGLQQRAGEKNVELSKYIDVRSRGGRGGGRGGDRPPRTEGGSPSGEAAAANVGEARPNRGGRGGRGGGGNRVPSSKNAFPDLPAPSAATQVPVAKAAATATPPATGSPKSTK